jgi:hypothetical protein
MVTETCRLLVAYAGSEIVRKKARQAAAIDSRRTLGAGVGIPFTFIITLPSHALTAK